jgi:hypothetical protein
VPRWVYFKVYCDVLQHPLLRQRPDCDVRLAIGLMAHAREYGGPEGILQGIDAAEARALFGIKAPLAKVQEGLDYLFGVGWLLKVDGGFVIRKFKARQGKNDSLESQAARQARYYAAHKDDIGERRRKRKSHGKADGVSHVETETALTGVSHGEVEGEEEILNPVIVARGGVRGGEFTACESGDKPVPMSQVLSDSQRLQVSQLLDAGKVTQAAALVVQFQRENQSPSESVQPASATSPK